MTCIADANVLFPLLVQGHAAHRVVRRWWEEQQDGTVGICLLTRLAVLRMLTNKIAMNGMPVTPDEAVQAWQQLQNDPRSHQIEAEPIDHEPRFVARISGCEPTRNLWTDAWLAALALSLDLVWNEESNDLLAKFVSESFRIDLSPRGIKARGCLRFAG